MKAPPWILIFAALVTVSVGTAVDAGAQHEGHQMPSAVAPVSTNPACALGGQKALAIVEAANQRVETARAASGRAGLQAAMSELQTAIAAAQAQLFTCRAAVPTASTRTTPTDAMAGMDHSNMATGARPATAPAASGSKPAEAMAGMDHSKMTMGSPAAGAKPTAPGAKPADPMAGMDHSKMNMGKPAPGAKPSTPGAKPADPMAGMDHSKMDMGKPTPDVKAAASGVRSEAQGAKPAKPESSAPMPGMDHATMPMRDATSKPGDVAAPEGREAKLPVMMAERVPDPACSDNIGQASAPKAVYQLKVYYFCSAAARDEFRKDPAVYLKKHPR